MPYDKELAVRVESCFRKLDKSNFKIKPMFGGIGYLVNGNMACGVHQENLIVRIGIDAYQAALEQPFISPFDLTGRPMRGWVYVLPDAITTERDLFIWINKGIDFAETLPKK